MFPNLYKSKKNNTNNFITYVVQIFQDLVRQNRPSVAVDYDVDIVHTEYSQEKILSAHVTDCDDVIINNAAQSTRGKLYVK